MDNGDVLIGVIAADKTLKRVVESYRPYANKVEISPLIGIAGFAESTRSILLIEYDRSHLEAAAMENLRTTSLSVSSK